MTKDYPLSGRHTSLKLREDCIPHSGFCANCATALPKRLAAVVVVIDDTGPLCQTCAMYTPIGSLSDGLRSVLIRGDPEEMIVECWRRLAIEDYRANRPLYPPEVQAVFDRIKTRAEEIQAAEIAEAKKERDEFGALCRLANEPFTTAVTTDL